MHRTHAANAVSMVVLATLAFSMMDAATKYIGAFLSFAAVLWSRYTIQAGMMAVWIWRSQGARGFCASHPRFQVLRGILLTAVSVLAFYGLRLMPLAEFTAIIMLSPVLVTAVAGWRLGEPVGRLRWVLVCGGFIGTLIVIRPGAGLFGIAAALPLAAMCINTAYALLTSRLAMLENPFTTQFYTGITGSILLAPVLAFQADALMASAGNLTAARFGLLALIGVLGTIGHLVLVMAFSRAGAAALMPFTYCQIAFAAMLSWFVFRHAPDFWAWVGMTLIAICGGTNAWLNMGRARSRATGATRRAQRQRG